MRELLLALLYVAVAIWVYETEEEEN